MFAAPILKARGESPIQWRVLFCQCRPTSPQECHSPPLPLLKSGLQHGNENCHPVPAAIMEFRGGRHRLNHNGIKEAREGTSRRRGRREEKGGHRLQRFRQGLVILSRHGFYWGGKGNILVPKVNTYSVSILSAAVIQEKSKRAAVFLRKLVSCGNSVVTLWFYSPFIKAQRPSALCREQTK